jgi:hypothetical protein
MFIKDELILTIAANRIGDKKVPFPLLAPVVRYDFLAPPDFDWRKYSNKIEPDWEVKESNARSKFFLVMSGLFFVIAAIFAIWLISENAYTTATVLSGILGSVSLLLAILGLLPRKIMLRMNESGITIKNKTFPYRSIVYAYFQYTIFRGSNESINFVTTEGKTYQLYLPYLGYSKGMLGRIVYTKLKIAGASTEIVNPYNSVLN